ncbi:MULTISPECIES: Crp/Fnr family transcriptional regulator [Xanthobacter]|uniref:Crp/Fnr family transcriptional regulator n=1 Tax=Xanthobacter TaxID=279 RepID=UPI00145DD245|nr:MULTISPECIES: cyclic nucleotide-binding domain-containing protein [Xanthobacter]NMN59256.1 CRP-like cAMP-binding protein [Xanthobacter sp. SG618]UDQ90760.1 cyclic nucleotide-binding domain-containing protein [Xanthobacter autotrophicus]UJX47547.1 cyclic nucleotide-binding domain-containing protein [Xanthobacter sp. YC-JY1]
MSIEDEARVLSRIPMFRDLEPSQLRLLAFSATRLDVAPGDVLFHQGEAPDAAYVILDGTAVIEVTAGGTTHEITRLTKDTVVGEMGVLTGEARSATVRAGAPMSVLRMDSDLFLALLDKTPSLARSVLRDLALRLQETTRALVKARG